MPENEMMDTPLNTLFSSLNLDTPEDPLHLDADTINSLIPRDYSMADYTYEVILARIKEFEEDLDNDHEVGIKLASFGQSITMSVTEIGYSNPSTLVFYGFVGEQPATLIQHVSQLNFLLLAVKKADPEKDIVDGQGNIQGSQSSSAQSLSYNNSICQHIDGCNHCSADGRNQIVKK